MRVSMVPCDSNACEIAVTACTENAGASRPQTRRAQRWTAGIALRGNLGFQSLKTRTTVVNRNSGVPHDEQPYSQGRCEENLSLLSSAACLRLF